MAPERLAEPPVGRTVDGEHHDPARLPVQSVVERRVGGGGAHSLQVTEDRCKKIVVGVRRGLLAGRARFLVVGQEVFVLKHDAGRVDFKETPRPAPGPPDADFLSAGKPFCRIAHRPAIHLNGTEVDEIGRIGFGQKKFFRDMRGEADALRGVTGAPAERGRAEPGQSGRRGPPFIRHRGSPRHSLPRPDRSRTPWPLPPLRPRPLPCLRPFRVRSSSSIWPWTGDRSHPSLP